MGKPYVYLLLYFAMREADLVEIHKLVILQTHEHHLHRKRIYISPGSVDA